MKLGKILAALVVTSTLLVGGALAPTADAATKAPTTRVTAKPGSVVEKKAFTVKGAITPARKNVRVHVQRQDAKGRWISVASAKTGSNGQVVIKAKLSRTAAKVTLRLVTPKSGKYAASVSGRFSVTIQTRTAKALAVAKAQVGKKYRYGSSGPKAFDCSGLTSYAYKEAGISLAHSARGQNTKGKKVAKKDLKPGDLVFFYAPISHVGMYIGNGKIVHAANPRSGVEIGKLSWMPFSGARRVG